MHYIFRHFLRCIESCCLLVFCWLLALFYCILSQDWLFSIYHFFFSLHRRHFANIISDTGLWVLKHTLTQTAFKMLSSFSIKLGKINSKQILNVLGYLSWCIFDDLLHCLLIQCNSKLQYCLLYWCILSVG